MNKRQLGKTDINLTAIGFGGAPLGIYLKILMNEIAMTYLKKAMKKGSIFTIHHLYMVMD